MRSPGEQQDSLDTANTRELQILTEVESSPDVTQRQLSQKVGIALGLTNALMRNLAKKGYLRASNASWKRWIYTLTPEGFSYRLKLTVDYIRRFLDHYQSVRQTLREQLEPLVLHEESRVAIIGTGEFAELVYLGLKEHAIEEIEVFATKAPAGSRFLGLAVHDISELNSDQFDRVMIATLGGSESLAARLLEAGTKPDQLVAFFVDGKSREGG